MLKFLRRLFCRHDYTWARNIHGDKIIECGWNRSIWRCAKCWKVQYRPDLHEPDEVTARAQRMERGEPIYSDGPLPERGWD